MTGATSGLGKTIAARLARDGAEVIVVGRNAPRGAETVDEVTTAGGRARFIAADLENPADIRRLAKDAGEIDVLVNNAGNYIFSPTEDLDVEDFDSVFDSNVRGPFYIVGAFAPAMVAKGGGIVNISSIAGRIGLPDAAAYGGTHSANPRGHGGEIRPPSDGARSAPAPAVCGHHRDERSLERSRAWCLRSYEAFQTLACYPRTGVYVRPATGSETARATA